MKLTVDTKGQYRRICPCCWTHVPRTSGDTIAYHLDSQDIAECPAWGYPYRITAPRRARRAA